MTLSIVSILSVTSAILFFGTGYLIASFLTKLKLTKVLLDKEQLIESRDMAYRELEANKVNLTEVKNECHSLNEQMVKLQSANAELKKNGSQAKNQYQELTICTRTLEAKTEKAELIWEENQQLKEENSYLHNKLQQLEHADKERRALAIQMERFKEQASQLEQYRNEVVSLQSVAEEVSSLRNKIEKLTAENAKLRSLSLVYQPSSQRAAILEQENLTNSLETILVRLAQSQEYREVVLADEQGLLVAGGHSEYSEDLAVVAAMFDDFVKKCPQMLPISTIQQLNVIDENGITITVHYFPLASGSLNLVSLTVGQGPDRATVEQLSSEISNES